jgi:hypothetical protein
MTAKEGKFKEEIISRSIGVSHVVYQNFWVTLI